MLPETAVVRPLRRAPLPRGKRSRSKLGLLGVVVLSILVGYPLVAVVAGSFGAGLQSGLGAVEWSHGYRTIFSDGRALANSLTIASLSAIFAMLFGTVMALVTVRTNAFAKRLIQVLVILPLFIAPLLLAIGWVVLAAPGDAGLINGWLHNVPGLGGLSLNVYSVGGIVWVLTTHYTPFFYLLMSGTLRNMDNTLDESSRMVGAGPIRTMLRIELPLMRPAIMGSIFLVFILAMGQFGVPAVLGMGRGYPVLTTQIYSYINQLTPDYQAASAIGVLLLLISFIGIYAQLKLIGKRSYVTITSRAFSRRLIDLGKWRKAVTGGALLYGVIAALLPLGALAWVSFLKYVTPNIVGAKYAGLGNYNFVLFHYPITSTALRNSVVLGLLGATIAAIVAGLAVWIIQRTRQRSRQLLEYVTVSPLAVPGMVFALGLLWAWVHVSFPPLYGSLWILLACYVTIFFPIAMRSIGPGMQQLDKSLEEAASVCGARRWRVVRTVTAPLLRPAITAGWVLVFILIINEVAAAALLANSGTVVIGLAIFDLLNQAPLTQAAAAAMLQVALLLAVLGLGRLLSYRRKGRRW